MILACPLLLLEHCANILLDWELGHIPDYRLRGSIIQGIKNGTYVESRAYRPVYGGHSARDNLVSLHHGFMQE